MTQLIGQKTPAHEVAEYLGIWMERFDPEFGRSLAGKTMDAVLASMNERYGTQFPTDTLIPAQLLFESAVAINAYAMARRMEASLADAKKTEAGNE